MSVLAPWSLQVLPGKEFEYEVYDAANLRLTNAALGHTLQDEAKRTTLTLTVKEPILGFSDDESDEDEDEEQEEAEEAAKYTTTEIVLTSLTPGKVCSLYFPMHLPMRRSPAVDFVKD